MKRVRPRGSAFLAAVVMLSCASMAAPAVARAQASDAPPVPIPTEATAGSPTLVVQSDPSGAVVVLRGPYEWTGTTPWKLYRPVSGLYHVQVRLAGYEAWSDDVVLGDGGVRNLDVHLGKRTALKAFVRSAVIPGWGQMYRGSKLKGSLFLAGSFLAAGGVIWTNEAYQNNVDDFRQARNAYEGITRRDDLAAGYARVRRASDKADRDYDRRQIALGVLGGIYAVNLLDSLFLSPSGDAASDVASAEGAGRVETTGAAALGGWHWLADADPAGGMRAGLSLRWN